jgi:glucose-1-phosphate thymidylyltransferase
MNAVLLAAGYGTRLYPLTRDTAKPLLPVGGRPIIDYLVDRLEAAPAIDRLVLVSNAAFYEDFREWAAGRSFKKPLVILDDGSTSNENRRGAVADVHFAVCEAGIEDEPAYVLATDNLPRFDLCDVIALSMEKGTSAVFACPEDDTQRLKRSGVAQLAEDGRIISFEEKPEQPHGNYRVPPFYCYTARAIRSVEQFLGEGNNPDAPGHFLDWLTDRLPVYALRRPEGTYDIGTLESYRAVCREFGEG